ncbi:phage tail sheath family protein [Sorangium sp. So ce406]|uniref:phage tail sheath family protein n=1 Tax=Sorangium sp. So ce406 TaxID=3133311 RepID=UPI003F5B2F8E
MPEYLSPGVYIEETSFRAKSIQGVATSTAGFVGACRFGPVQGPPPLVTSFEEFRRTFGGIEDVVLAGTPTTNYLAHAVKSFFDNGGQRLYIARVFKTSTGDGVARSPILLKEGAAITTTTKNVGAASANDFSAGTVPLNPRFVARHPGVEGNLQVSISGKRGSNALTGGKLVGLKPGDIVEVSASARPAPVTNSAGTSPLVAANLRWVQVNDLGQPQLVNAAGVVVAPGATDAVQRVTLTVQVGNPGARIDTYAGISTHPRSASYLLTVLRRNDPSDSSARVAFEVDLPPAPADPTSTLAEADFDELLVRLIEWGSATLAGGNDGAVPTSTEYKGAGVDATVTGLVALGEIEDIAIVAAPGHSAYGADTARQAVRNELITHCETLKYRFAILSAANGLDEAGIRSVRSQHDTSHAALYFPWVVVPDPFSATGEVLELPPEGSVAGIYARTDVERGVHKAPANEVVRDALRFSRRINTGQQDTLNPEGINCLRSFEGRGNRVWGARTMSSDPEWMYVNVRRLFIYLEHSIEKNTKWAVFEPNNESLWLKVRLTIESFLLETWRTGALMGRKPEEAYFVRCDRSTMTQSDLDNGRLVVLIGVAPTKPAEFVVFRIGQWTADAAVV